MKCAVTGANGYVGSVIVRYLSARGHQVYQLRRDANQLNDKFALPYTLENGIPPKTIEGIDALVHCAYDFRPASWKQISRVNIEGSRRLFQAAKQAGVKNLVFISTMSAFHGCKSLYGQAKLEIEAEASQLKAAIIRPGLVYGPAPGGMMGALLKMVSQSSVIPLFGGGMQKFNLVHQDDLGELTHLLCTQSKQTDCPNYAASEAAFTFKRILEMLAEYKGKRLFFVPVPWQPIYLGLKIAESIGLSFRLRSDSLISLLNQDPAPRFEATRTCGIAFRMFNMKAFSI